MKQADMDNRTEVRPEEEREGVKDAPFSGESLSPQEDEQNPPVPGTEDRPEAPAGEEKPAEEREASLAEKLKSSEVALKTAEDRYLRTVAELDNFKKRTARETEEFRKYANVSLVQKLLPALDNLERAMDSAGKDEAISAIVAGLRITLADILKVFSEFHVKCVEAEGKKFDPVYHMAVAHEETDAADPDTVIRIFQKGYMMHDRLIRPAMVSVAKAMAAPAENQSGGAGESNQAPDQSVDADRR
ncbi:nucleotide exchange factor GrpE [Desulfobotulus sp. H1]|uniref:Protein GrpE n=1 Tax=Desulfobotulus pelophilus TaxID=2823377 RepID=A0ABT3NAH0_9BACT|nr:nucleotide exchange factor GrpE [Desulfobotulus pelophilus]MCW7754458.1 nucleotide exchange factor GrpE [Desulfobotulus pelophilus]